MRQGVDGFRDPEVGDIIGRRFRAQESMVAHVLLERAVAVVAPDHRIGQVEIFDARFELAAVPPGDLAAEDGGEFRGLPDGPVRIEEALA